MVKKQMLTLVLTNHGKKEAFSGLPWDFDDENI